MAGELRLVVSSDLGGLGPTRGAPLLYRWGRANLLPEVLPWMAVLGLLLLRPNRDVRAWWVWVPLVTVNAVAGGVLSLAPTELADQFLEPFTSLAFGVAAVWLLAPYLGTKSRLVLFFAALLSLGLGSVGTQVLRADWSGGGPERFGVLVLLGVCAFTLALAICLTSLMCRHRFAGLRVALWSLVWLAVAWTLTTAPVWVVALVVRGGGSTQVLGFIAGLTLATFLSLLPFLLLSFAQPFYRQRLRAFLRVAATATGGASAA